MPGSMRTAISCLDCPSWWQTPLSFQGQWDHPTGVEAGDSCFQNAGRPSWQALSQDTLKSIRASLMQWGPCLCPLLGSSYQLTQASICTSFTKHYLAACMHVYNQIHTHTQTYTHIIISPHFFTKLDVEILQSPWTVLHSPDFCLEKNSLARHLQLLHLQHHMFLARGSRKLFSLISSGENPPCSLCLNFVPRNTCKQRCCGFLFINLIS